MNGRVSPRRSDGEHSKRYVAHFVHYFSYKFQLRTEQVVKVGATQAHDAGSDQVATTAPRCGWQSEQADQPPACWRDRSTDRDKLAVACATLRRYGIAAVGGQHGSPREIADRLIAAIRARFPDADGACVFWTAGDESARLGPEGWLTGPLTLHLHGPAVAEAATAAFESAGLATKPGPSADLLLIDNPSRLYQGGARPVDPFFPDQCR